MFVLDYFIPLYLCDWCDVADRMCNDYFAKRNFVENVRNDVIIMKRLVPITNVIDPMASRINRSPRLDKFGDTFFFLCPLVNDNLSNDDK